MARFDLTDKEWAAIAPVLPSDVRGVEREDDRWVLNGIFWRLRTGAPLGGYPGPLWAPAMGRRPPATIAS